MVVAQQGLFTNVAGALCGLFGLFFMQYLHRALVPDLAAQHLLAVLDGQETEVVTNDDVSISLPLFDCSQSIAPLLLIAGLVLVSAGWGGVNFHDVRPIDSSRVDAGARDGVRLVRKVEEVIRGRNAVSDVRRRDNLLLRGDLKVSAAELMTESRVWQQGVLHAATWTFWLMSLVNLGAALAAGLISASAIIAVSVAALEVSQQPIYRALAVVLWVVCCSVGSALLLEKGLLGLLWIALSGALEYLRCRTLCALSLDQTGVSFVVKLAAWRVAGCILLALWLMGSIITGSFNPTVWTGARLDALMVRANARAAAQGNDNVLGPYLLWFLAFFGGMLLFACVVFSMVLLIGHSGLPAMLHRRPRSPPLFVRAGENHALLAYGVMIGMVLCAGVYHSMTWLETACGMFVSAATAVLQLQCERVTVL